MRATLRPTSIAFYALAFFVSGISQESLAAPQLVLIGQTATVDTDGDFTADIFDNAPGVSNDQADLDNDLIGDVIDPTPNMSNPNLGFTTIFTAPTTLVPAGGSAQIDYFVSPVPPGQWGRVQLDFGGDSTYDAVYFGPLDATFNSISIPANLYVAANWNLNLPGNYTVHSIVIAPGMQSEAYTITDFTVVGSVVPEPGSLLLGLGIVAIGGLFHCRESRRGKPS